MHRQLTSLIAVAGLVAGSADAQSWTSAIAQQWPGASIRKVSEKQFEAFVAQHLASLPKAGAYDAFLDAQYRAYGLPTTSPWPKSFPVPSHDQHLKVIQRRFDSLVREGAEPNGNPSTGGTPTPLSCGDQADGAIDVGADQDWYRFTLNSLTTVQALSGPGLTGAGLPGAVADTIVEIYDAALNLVAVNDDYSVQYTSAIRRGTYSMCEVELPAGTYYVNVKAFGAAMTGSYTLDLRCTPPFQIVSEGPEPNDDPNNGGTPTLMAIGQQGDGNCNPTGDHDWWQFLVTQPSTVILVTGPSMQNGSPIVDSIMTLLDSTFQQLGNDDDGGPLAYSQIVATLQPGTYYADIGGYNGRPGTYRLLIQQIPIPSSPVAEAAEPNGDPRNGGIPTPIACGQIGAGEIVTAGGGPPTGDDDWWSFTVTNAGWRTIYLLPDVSSPNALAPCNDTELWLHDAQYNQLAYDDDGGVSLYSEVGAWLQPGTYYAHVEGYGANNVGNYFIVIECAGGLPGFATLAAGCAGTNGRVPTVTTRDLELAVLGSTFVADFLNLPPNGALFPFVGFSNTTASAGYPLPLDLSVIGAPGCRVASDPLVALPLSSNQFGTAQFALGLPLNPTLVGVVLYTQAVVVDPGVNSLGITTSDVGVIVLGNRL